MTDKVDKAMSPVLEGVLRPFSGLTIFEVPDDDLTALAAGFSEEIIEELGAASRGVLIHKPEEGKAWCRSLAYGLLKKASAKFAALQEKTP